MPSINSPTNALLSLPAIGAGGIENSVVFHQLPGPVQEAIRGACSPQDKARIAIDAGDQLPVIAEMYDHYIAAPARRAQSGEAFPSCESLDQFFLPGVARESDRPWIRLGCSIQSVEVRENHLGWVVEAQYVDGVVRVAVEAPYPTANQAEHRKQEVVRTATLLGLMS